MDNKGLTDGSTICLPVWQPGAKFSVGDGHGRQGDGEVCVNALEMGLTGTFTFTLSMGFNEDLDQAMKQALREMIDFIGSRSRLIKLEAYQLCSLDVDFRVTQAVNGDKGVHGINRKGLIF